MATETIGSGGDRATVAAWFTAIDTTLGEAETGQLLAQNHTGQSWTLNGKTTSAANYVELTVAAANRHDGRAHEVSGAGNARAEWDANAYGIFFGDDHQRVSWLELFGPGSNNLPAIRCAWTGATNETQIHHCVIHNANTAAGGSLCMGVYVSDADTIAKIYRNVVYGCDDANIGQTVSTSGCFIIHNTCYETAVGDGIVSKSGDEVESNAAFESADDDLTGAGTEDDNATSDATGDSGASLASLTATNEFKSATTTWASTDLTLKRRSNLVAKSTGSPYSSVTYPEIGIGIRGNTINDSVWDVGADQLGDPTKNSFGVGSKIFSDGGA